MRAQADGTLSVPKGWNLFADATSYCMALSHVRPALQPTRAVLEQLLKAAVATGRPAYGEHRLALCTGHRKGKGPRAEVRVMEWAEMLLQQNLAISKGMELGW